MPPIEDEGLQPPTPEELEAEKAQLTDDEDAPKPPEPQVVEKIREPNEDELRGAALRMIEAEPERFRGALGEPPEPPDLSYDPQDIHNRAVQEAEQRMLYRTQLIDGAIEDAQRHFSAKSIPEHVYSKVRKALGDPSLSLQDLAGHIKSGAHRRVVTDAVGEMALAGEWNPVQTNTGGEPIGGGGSGMSGEQREELQKAEGLLGRKLTPQEQKEWVVSN